MKHLNPVSIKPAAVQRVRELRQPDSELCASATLDIFEKFEVAQEA
jgi:hypothetical protein